MKSTLTQKPSSVSTMLVDTPDAMAGGGWERERGRCLSPSPSLFSPSLVWCGVVWFVLIEWDLRLLRTHAVALAFRKLLRVAWIFIRRERDAVRWWGRIGGLHQGKEGRKGVWLQRAGP